jgi:hypothetical protein
MRKISSRKQEEMAASEYPCRRRKHKVQGNTKLLEK